MLQLSIAFRYCCDRERLSQKMPSLDSIDGGDTEAGLEKLRDLTCSLEQQLKVENMNRALFICL